MDATFATLVRRLSELHDAVLALRLTALDDQPEAGATALVDGMANDVVDVLADVEAALQAAVTAEDAVGRPTDAEKAVEMLWDCREPLNRLLWKFAAEMTSWRRVGELRRLGRQREEWQGWTDSVLEGIERCQIPLYESAACLSAGLLELLDRSLNVGPSLRATAVYQQVRVSSPEAREVTT